MTHDPPELADPLESSDSPSAALEGNLSTVTDDEFFAALDSVPIGTDEQGNQYHPTTGVLDLRHLPEDTRALIRDVAWEGAQ